MDDRPCIELTFAVIGGREVETMTVADYDAVQRQEKDQPIWAWVVPPVEQLTDKPARHGARIVDRDAYAAQMRALTGLDPA